MLIQGKARPLRGRLRLPRPCLIQADVLAASTPLRGVGYALTRLRAPTRGRYRGRREVQSTRPGQEPPSVAQKLDLPVFADEPGERGGIEVATGCIFEGCAVPRLRHSPGECDRLCPGLWNHQNTIRIG